MDLCGEDFVDFDDEPNVVVTKEKPAHLYNNGGILCDYDETTLEYYRVIRQRKMNVFLPGYSDFDSSKSFMYPYRWNPYSGEKIDVDPYGPLCFFPDDLIYNFYIKRLDMLWTDAVDEFGGFYEGFYGDAVGAGKSIEIAGRGSYPERYLFRLPITNCYLPKSHNMIFITMGPILSDEEILEIDELANKFGNYYRKTYRKNRPSLYKMKQLYDQAISKTPDISKLISKEKEILLTNTELAEIRERANKEAVEELKKL